MDDEELARKLRRSPSLLPIHMRGVIAFFEVTRENPRLPPADELAALELVAQRASQASDAIMALGWYGSTDLESALAPGVTLSDTCRQLGALAAAANTARSALAQGCRSGRPPSNLSLMIMMLADLIESGGGTVDAKQGGELCQAFGVALEALGLSVANHRETVRAALNRRSAKQ